LILLRLVFQFGRVENLKLAFFNHGLVEVASWLLAVSVLLWQALEQLVCLMVL